MFGIFKRVKRLEDILKPRYEFRVDARDRVSDMEERIERICSVVNGNHEQFHKFAEQQGYKWEEKTEKKWVKKVKK